MRVDRESFTNGRLQYAPAARGLARPVFSTMGVQPVSQPALVRRHFLDGLMITHLARTTGCDGLNSKYHQRMPIFYEITDKKRRRSTWKTSRNNRIEPMDARDVSLLKTSQYRIFIGVHGLIISFVPLLQSLLSHAFGIIHRDVGELLIYICSID